MTDIDVGSNDVNLKCKVRRSDGAINPQFCPAQDMTCTLKNWHGSNNSPTGIASIGFTSDKFFDQLSNSGHGKRRIKASTDGPELVLMPMSPKGRNSNHNSDSGGSDRVAALADSFHQRFHSFGSIPIASNFPPSIEIPLRPPSIKTRKNSKLAIDIGNIYDNNNNNPAESNHESLTPRSKNVNNNINALNNDNSETSASTNNSECLNIPITDIIVVDIDGSHSQPNHKNMRRTPRPQVIADVHPETHQMYVTSMTSGYFEFTFYSKNAQDVMLAFLQSTLPSERITRTRCDEPQESKLVTSPSTAIADTSYDMDYLTEKEMNGILETESISERILSKVQSIVSTFDVFTSTFTQCVSCDKRSKYMPSSPTNKFQKKALSFTDNPALAASVTDNGSVILHSRSDVPFLFSYEDSVREAPSPPTDGNTYISYSVVSNNDDSETNSSYRSSFSRSDTDRWKKVGPPPIPTS